MIASGVLVFLGRLIFSSKCNHVMCCWGCVQVDREVNLELTDLQPSNTNSFRGFPSPVRNIRHDPSSASKTHSTSLELETKV